MLFTMQWRLQIFVLLFIIFGRNATAQFIDAGESRCETPNRKPGVCIIIKECPQYVRLLQEKPVAQSTLEFLQISQCGFEGNHPKVCCEGIVNVFQSRPSRIQTTVRPRQLARTINYQQSNLNSLQPPNVTRHRRLRLLNHDICGPINSGKIVGGNRTGLFEFPWMALLVYTTGGANPEFRCSGSVINKRYVLTAAHCVANLSENLILFGVRIGEHDITTERDCELAGTFEEICAEKYQDIKVEKIHAHPNFSLDTLHNDIALLRLAENIDFESLNARPICLPIGPAAKITSKKMMVSGWGITKESTPSTVMMKIALPRASQEKCAALYKKQKEIWHKQICMGGNSTGDACGGDSGGPLQAPTIYYGNPRYVQYGIVSFSVKNCNFKIFPGVYTRVDFYLDWILNTMRD